MLHPKLEEIITYHEFKEWVVQSICSFICYKIPYFYIRDSPKQTLKEWINEFLEWCGYELVEIQVKEIQDYYRK